MTKKTRKKPKVYDDDLLVELISRGDLTDKQIAQRVGVSHGLVGDVSSGRRRSDLQTRINVAARSYVREAGRRQGCRGCPHADKSPTPQSQRKKEYDDDRLVELIAAGNVSHKNIAAEIGISMSMVSRISRADARSDLQPRIGALVRSRREEFERLAAAVLKPALVKQARIALKGDGETGRKARQHIIDTFRYPPDPVRLAALPPAGELARRPKLPLRSMTELSLPLKAAVLRELGGPELGPEDYAEAGVPYPGPDEDEETGDWLRRPLPRGPAGLSPGEPEAAGPQGVPVPISGAPPTAAQEDAAALQKNDAASRSRCPSGSGPPGEQEQKNDVAHPPSGESPPEEEGCSRNKKRRRRQRRQVDSFIR